MRTADSSFQPLQVTKHQAAVFPAKMHPVTLTVCPGLAVLAGLEFVHPTPVAVVLETVFPDLPEGVLIDITLIILAAYGGTGGYRTVNQDRGNADTGGTLVQMIPHTSFVGA